jgi:hypothetical protein
VVVASALGVVAGAAACQGGHSVGVNVGTVRGRLVAVGGPVTRRYPMPGHVTAIATAGGLSQTVRVGKDGEFSFNLPVGSYHFTGTNPRILGGNETCMATRAVRVRAAHTITGIQVICPIR